MLMPNLHFKQHSHHAADVCIIGFVQSGNLACNLLASIFLLSRYCFHHAISWLYIHDSCCWCVILRKGTHKSGPHRFRATCASVQQPDLSSQGACRAFTYNTSQQDKHNNNQPPIGSKADHLDTSTEVAPVSCRRVSQSDIEDPVQTPNACTLAIKCADEVKTDSSKLAMLSTQYG